MAQLWVGLMDDDWVGMTVDRMAARLVVREVDEWGLGLAAQSVRSLVSPRAGLRDIVKAVLLDLRMASVLGEDSVERLDETAAVL